MPADNNPLPRIARIEVHGLFGLFDHVIELKSAERVSVVHGPNGVGKTTLLRLIEALFKGNIDTLANVPFTRFHVSWSDGAFILVEGAVEISPSNPDEGIMEQASKKLKFQTVIGDIETTFTGQFQRYPTPPRVHGSSELQARYARLFIGERWAGGNLILGPRLRRFEKRFEVLFITAQRLHRLDDHNSGQNDEVPVSHPGVWAIASDLQRRIQRAADRLAGVAEALAQSFPNRLLQLPESVASVEALRERLRALEARRTALQQVGLLDESHAKPLDAEVLAKMTPAQSGVMSLYAADNEEKLEVFHELAAKVEVFLRMINSRFLRNTVRADRERGLQVLDPAGHPVELTALSSGEQHQLIMFYDLLFRTPAGTLVLIDEPELSQHVVWQRRFLPDLLEIVGLAHIDALVATHSPSIVGAHRDLLVALSPEADDAGDTTDVS